MQITPDSALYCLILILLTGNLLAFVVGVLMLTMLERPGGALFQLTDRWISMRRITKPLEVPHQTDHVMLRYPRSLSVILLASAVLILAKGTAFVSEPSVADGGRQLAVSTAA